jgi:hypothetical protein
VKPWFSCALALCVLAAFPASTGPAATSASLRPELIGRYQIIPARITTSDMTGTTTVSETVFQLDTITGRTLIYRSILVGTKLRSGWSEVHEEPALAK